MEERQPLKYPKHDEFVRYVISQTDIARAIFIKFLHPKKLKPYKLDTLELEDSTFVDEEMSKLMSDVVFKLQFKKDIAYAYFLFEHKSEGAQKSPSSNLPWQLFRQEIRLKEKMRLNHDAYKIPQVLGIAFYHGASEYGGPKSIAETMEGPQEYIDGFWKKPVTLIDLNNYDDKILKEESARLTLFLLALKHIYSGNLVEVLTQLPEAFAELAKEPHGQQFLIGLLNYLLHKIQPEQHSQIMDFAVKSISERVGGEAVTAYEHMVEEAQLKIEKERGVTFKELEERIEKERQLREEERQLREEERQLREEERQLREEERKQTVLSLIDEGYSIPNIARILHLDHHVVEAILRDASC